MSSNRLPDHAIQCPNNRRRHIAKARLQSLGYGLLFFFALNVAVFIFAFLLCGLFDFFFKAEPTIYGPFQTTEFGWFWGTLPKSLNLLVDTGKFAIFVLAVIMVLALLICIAIAVEQKDKQKRVKFFYHFYAAVINAIFLVGCWWFLLPPGHAGITPRFSLSSDGITNDDGTTYHWSAISEAHLVLSFGGSVKVRSGWEPKPIETSLRIFNSTSDRPMIKIQIPQEVLPVFTDSDELRERKPFSSRQSVRNRTAWLDAINASGQPITVSFELTRSMQYAEGRTHVDFYDGFVIDNRHKSDNRYRPGTS